MEHKKLTYEPPHDKTNKMTVHPVKTDQTGWRSAWAFAQSDRSLRWAQRSFCWFCHEAAHMFTGCGILFLWTIFIISYDEIFQLNL